MPRASGFSLTFIMHGGCAMNGVMLVSLDPLGGSRAPCDHALAWSKAWCGNRGGDASRPAVCLFVVVWTACCALRAENIFVCCCCAGLDRAAGVRGMQALGLVRDDGRPCLGRCSHTTISRLRLSDRPLEFSAPARSCTARAAVDAWSLK